MITIYKAVVLLAGMAGIHPAADKAPAPADHPPAVTVRQVLTMQALAWQTVQVSGRCLANGTPALAVGSRPYSGRVWQLEDNGVATWVIGEMPKACREGNATITARVVQDTLPLFSPPRTLRQYLMVR